MAGRGPRRLPLPPAPAPAPAPKPPSALDRRDSPGPAPATPTRLPAPRPSQAHSQPSYVLLAEERFSKRCVRNYHLNNLRTSTRAARALDAYTQQHVAYTLVLRTMSDA
ncbi:Protein of unknown function [Gryllus bimaculatus]|nr:Protein of unknown function [Gryllus bimaculatus]